MSSIAEDAWALLYPQEKIPSINLKYSSKFRGYNARVRCRSESMDFSLSSKWIDVSREIQTGLIQSLILRLKKDRQSSIYVDMYNIFLKKVGSTVQKEFVEPELLSSFERVNNEYFEGLLEMPNLVFGQNSYRKLGSYEFGTDTVTISSLLRGQEDLIDYVIYHELLHKKHKFLARPNRNLHHTREFREDEKKFRGYAEAETRISRLINRKRIISWF